MKCRCPYIVLSLICLPQMSQHWDCLQGKEKLSGDPDSYFSQQKYEGVYSSNIYILLPLLLVAYLVSLSIVIAKKL